MKRRYRTLSLTPETSVLGSYPFGRYPICVRNVSATMFGSEIPTSGVLLTTCISNSDLTFTDRKQSDVLFF